MLTKPIIKNFAPDDLRKVFSFQLPNTKAGRINLQVDEYSLPRDMFVTKLIDSDGNTLGSEIFGLSGKSDMFDYNIEVNNPHKGKGFGELLRLTNIIEMIENKINLIRLYSKNTAIYFHSKYKFEPNIKSFSHRNEALRNIVSNKSNDVQTFSTQASELLKRIEKTDIFDYDEQSKISKQANKIIKEYIQQIMQNNKQKEAPFDVGFDMQLTLENVLNNADFFNALFRKHGIDYKI